MIKRLGHLTELVLSPHADAIGEVSPLDRLGALLDPVDRAGDRVNQHRREQSRNHVHEQEH